jgi:nucleotide-binding universal stress UspA family protein
MPRIVVGVDGSEASLEALRWAFRQAELTRARLEIVTAWEPAPAAPYGWSMAVPAGPIDYDPVAVATKVAADAVSLALGDTSQATVETETRVIEGHPAPTLVETSQGADLLVVGSSGHGAFVGMLLGSVSAHCARHASCPVVIVRPAVTSE